MAALPGGAPGVLVGAGVGGAVGLGGGMVGVAVGEGPGVGVPARTSIVALAVLLEGLGSVSRKGPLLPSTDAVFVRSPAIVGRTTMTTWPAGWSQWKVQTTLLPLSVQEGGIGPGLDAV